MNNIDFFNETGKEIPDIEILENLINYAVEKENIENAIFSINFVDNAKIKALNAQYRNIDKETDVLSFALEDSNDINYDNVRLLGDIFISTDKAYSQSIEYGHSYLRELSFLMIHGFLHLIGYDHEDEADRQIMNTKEEAILDGFGIEKRKKK